MNRHRYIKNKNIFISGLNNTLSMDEKLHLDL